MSIKNYGFPFENIYCISLKTSEKRREHIKKELTKNKIFNYITVDAVDKNDKIIEEAYENGMVKLFPPCFRCAKKDCNCENNVLIPAQVATFFSHKNIWKEISKQDSGLYLVIEDDIKINWYYRIFKKYFNQKINNIFTKNKNNPFLLRLGWAKNLEHKLRFIKINYGQVRMSNPMYAINPQMAKILLEKFKIIDTTVDIFLHKNIATQYPNYTLMPPIAHELSWSRGNMESLIRPRISRIKHLTRLNDKESKEELKEYERHIDKAVNKEILFIGHPRTGSGYISELLKSFTLDVGHEKMGRNGIVSWMFTVYDLRNPFYLNKYALSRYYTSFKNIIMFARDPYTAISSIMRENDSSEVSYKFRRKHVLKNTGIDLDIIVDKLERAVEMYYLWSKLAIENNNPELIVRVEYDENILFDYLKQNSYKVHLNEKKLPKKNVNSDKPYKGKVIKKDVLSELDWIELDIEYKEKLNELCEMLGYEPIYNQKYNKIERI